MRRGHVLCLYACFFVSGASALAYEMVWQRMLTLVFGLSTVAVATVLCAFLAGLAVGARAFSSLADRSPDPLRLYARVELLIALLGLASAFWTDPLMTLYGMIRGVIDGGWLLSNGIRFVLAFVVLGIPSCVIGATVPLMARLVTAASRSTAVGFSRFYAVNTVGSVAGAGLSGFLLIRVFGVHGTLLFAVCGNVLASAVAWMLRARVGPAPFRTVAESITAPQAMKPGPRRRIALVLACVTGFVALAYEVAWTRLLAIFTLNSVYVFTMVVTVFLAGLSGGAALAKRYVQGSAGRASQCLAVTQIGVALCVPLLLAAVPWATRLPIHSSDASIMQVFMAEYVLAVCVMGLPALLIGMSLPLVVALYGGEPDAAGRAVGRVYAWNALGTIAGAALAGLMLVPFLGLRGTLLGAAALNFAVAAVVSATHAAGGRAWVMPAGAAAFVGLIAVAPGVTRFYRPSTEPDETILYYAEGPSATVHVSEVASTEGRHRVLFVDSQSVAGTYDEIVTDQKMLAHLPLLIHPSPQRVLTVGFGTGGTSYSMLQHRVEVHCVEIEPRVPDAFDYFRSENHGMVGPDHERPEFNLVLDDARAWLHAAPETYDVIVTDLTSIQYRGNGNLYTVDCFELMRSRLAPGGMGCAWVPMSGIAPEQLKVLLRSFRAAFEHTSVWYMVNLPTDFVIVIGTEDRLTLDLRRMAERLDKHLIRRDLETIGMANAYKLASCLLLAEDDVAAYVGHGPVHTDDRPILDYMTHASPYRHTLTENLLDMLAHRSDAAEYVTHWHESDGGGATWLNWSRAARHLMEGHAWIHGKAIDRRERVLEAYSAASALTPGDATTRSLVQGLTRDGTP